MPCSPLPPVRATTYQVVGDVAVAHEELGAVEDVVVAVLLGGKLHALGVEAGRGLGEGQRPDLLAGGDARQVLLLLGVGAGLENRQGGDGRRDEGAGHQGAAELFDQDDQVHESEAGAAVRVRNGQALPALVGHLLPQVGRVALLVLFHVAHVLLGALLLQEVTREIAEHLLLFAESQVHYAVLLMTYMRPNETRGYQAPAANLPRPLGRRRNNSRT